MKMRLYRDSIRFRLSPRDVETLQSTGRVRELTRFTPEAELSYTVRLSADAASPTATLSAADITVLLPTAVANQWAQSEAVSIRHELATGGGRSLVILIEKDFECLDSLTQEAEELFYPNPNKSCL